MWVFGGSSGGIRNEKRSQRTISKPAASISRPVLTLMARWNLASLERRSQLARFVRRDAAHLPADLRETLFERLVDQPYRLIVDWLRQRLPDSEPAPDLYPLALILVEPMGSYRAIRQTFDRVPDDIDDERFIAAWVQTALALARHYGLEGA
jgi:hypothetical protein